MNELIEKDLIPLDKSWMMRLGVLDLFDNYEDTLQFLERQKCLSDDLKALHRASRQWKKGEQKINVGESGTLYRFLQFASWKYNLDKQFVKEGTLLRRKMCENPEITNTSLEELLQLDNHTSQWASAAVLCGNQKVLETRFGLLDVQDSHALIHQESWHKERISNPSFKLKLTYDAVTHWNEKRKQGKVWEMRYDETILNQATAFLNYLKIGNMDFIPIHSEDYCFARAFNVITKEEASQKWPSLAGHESNRLEEMEKYLGYFKDEIEIDSKDHRIVQAIAMLSLAQTQESWYKKVKFTYPQAVNKSWPQFWEFLAHAKENNP